MCTSALGFIACTKMPKSAAGPAQTPPMGWNSWDCFGTDATETAVQANADYMAEYLLQFGRQFIVVDFGWYLPTDITTITFKQDNPEQALDEWGRLIPNTDKFPSAADGKGFKPPAVNQASENNRQLYRHDPAAAWSADASTSKDKYVALFNIGDEDTISVSAGWDAIGVHSTATVRNLWSGKELGEFASLFSADLPPHGSGLYRITVH